MKNIKNILLIAGALLCTINTSAQEEETSFFGSQSLAGPNTGGGTDDADPDPNPAAPINDYLPLLVIGAGLVALRYRKQLLKN